MIMDYELQYKNKVIPFTSTLRSLHFSYWNYFINSLSDLSSPIIFFKDGLSR